MHFLNANMRVIFTSYLIEKPFMVYAKVTLKLNCIRDMWVQMLAMPHKYQKGAEYVLKQRS